MVDDQELLKNNKKDDEIYKLIGKKIRELREKHHLSQEELGKRLNIPGQNIFRFETCLVKTPIHIILKLMKLYDVDFNYFINENRDYQNYKFIETNSIPLCYSSISSNGTEIAFDRIIKYINIENINIDNDNLIAYEVQDNSYAPEIKSKDIAIIKLFKQNESKKYYPLYYYQPDSYKNLYLFRIDYNSYQIRKVIEVDNKLIVLDSHNNYNIISKKEKFNQPIAEVISVIKIY
jgi:transcriptional regulator with XRE-family HTH domain